MVPLTSISEQHIFNLIDKLEESGPRYTSYPTAPVWKKMDFTSDFINALRRVDEEQKPIAVYMHFPYCHLRCLYCGCNSCITKDQSKFRTYIDALKKEIDMVSSYFTKGVSHSQLHLGGGTPTYTPPELLAEVLDYLIEKIPGAQNVDRSVEVDPRVTTKEHLKLLVDRGFKRISIGLQDLDPNVQRAVNRVFSFDKMKKFVSLAKELGFTSVNIDLIYGLPLQTRNSWKKTMESVLEFNPDRLACFGYAHLPSKIKHQKAIKEEDLPSSKERLCQLLDANRFFTQRGFVMVGMDHFAKADDELAQARKNGKLWRNFMGYTNNRGLELLGLGCSAISEFNDLFVQNLFPPNVYEEKLKSDSLPLVRGLKLDNDDIIRKAFINNLMCNMEIEIPDFDNKTTVELKKSLNKIARFEDSGMVIQNGDGYRVTPLGQLFLRNIAMVFDRYLSKDTAGAFSKTI